MDYHLQQIAIDLPNGLTAWVVDGGQVRENCNIDFTLGGHGYVYEFIPKDEIWLDDDTAEDEMIFVLIHEMHERALMKDGITYDEAHNQASNYEMLARQNPEKIEELLGTAEKENTASFEIEAENDTVLVLDIDGTIADLSHREYLVDRPDPDWDTFSEPKLVAQDDPYPEAQKALPKLMEEASDVYFISGRNERLRQTTTKWLKENYGITVPEDHLFLRPNGDYTNPIDFKRSVVENILEEGKDYLFIDDDQDNLEMFADYGDTMQAPACWRKLARIAMRVHADAFAGPYDTGDVPGGKQNMACPICGWESDEFAQNASKTCKKCGADLSSVPSTSFSINNSPNEEFVAANDQLTPKQQKMVSLVEEQVVPNFTGSWSDLGTEVWDCLTPYYHQFLTESDVDAVRNHVWNMHFEQQYQDRQQHLWDEQTQREQKELQQRVYTNPKRRGQQKFDPAIIEEMLKRQQVPMDKIDTIKKSINDAQNPGTKPLAPVQPKKPDSPEAPQPTYPGQNEPYKGLTGQMGQNFGEPTPTRSIYDEPPAMAEVAEDAEGHYTIQELTDAFAEQLGRQIGIDWNSVDFSPADFKKGILVELEHGSSDGDTNVTMDDPDSTGKIAWVHLKERPDYYDRLEEAENAERKNMLTTSGT